MMLNRRYRLLERIGSGGMAIVYRGTDTLLQRRVAVKVLREQFAGDPAFLARFKREAQAAANLDHVNIVTVHDVGQDGDRHYIVMEYVDGQDLKMSIRQEGRLSVAQALDIATQICEGVGHAHEAGVIHCDIKPQNVLITLDDRAKVVDFGIARALSESGLTEAETVWGSPLYFAPEQAAGEPPTPASDVYSIGVVMYEMLTGSPPFQAEGATALAMKHLREEPPSLTVRNARVPSGLEWIVRKVLAKDPSARYRTAGQMARSLEEYRSEREQMTGPQQPSARSLPSTSSPDHEASIEGTIASDGLTWMLVAIAFIAVMGLIPLWGLVYRSYAALPTSPPTSTPTPLVTRTPTISLISAPDLVDDPEDEAREKVRDAGLSLEIVEERDVPGVEENIVIEQTPSPGERVPLDSTVSVVVSGPGRKLTMPDVVGRSADEMRKGLVSNDLRVNVERVWSAEPEGQVVMQEPEGGATIRAGEIVTLTVSGGHEIALEVNLDEKILLKSAELRQRTFKPGDMIQVTLHWRALRSTEKHYVVFVHLIDPGFGPEGRLIAQTDEEPQIPTTGWTPGTDIDDPRQFNIPADQRPGSYQLRAGMYPQGQPGARLKVSDAGFTTATSDSILIAEVEVQR